MNKEQLAAFPESIRDWDEAKNAESPEKFWDQMSNLRSKIGTGLYQPSEDAGTEDWGKFTKKAIELSGDKLIPRPDLEDKEQRDALYAALGRPSDKAGYEFEAIEGMNLDDTRKAFLSEIAFEAGLTKSQLKLLDSKVRNADLVAIQQAGESHEGQLKELKAEWGLTYDDRVHTAKKIASTFFPQLGEDTNFTAAELKSFHSLAAQLGKGTTEFRQQGDQHNNEVSPIEAAEKIAEIRNNKEHPYNNPRAHGHDIAKKQMRNLYLAKNGQKTE